MNGGAYNLAFEEVVRKESPYCELISPRFSPTIGSALIALEKIGVHLDEALLRKIEENLNESK
jgi:hypothetical protein